MKRVFGMLQAADVEKEKVYKSDTSGKIIVQAAPGGWTIIWSDGGSDHKDYDDSNRTTEENFQEALNLLESYFPGIAGDDLACRNVLDNYKENQRPKFDELVERVLHRLNRDLDVMYQFFEEYPSVEEFRRRQETENLYPSYENEGVLTTQRYNITRTIMKSLGKEEFIKKLEKAFNDVFDKAHVNARWRSNDLDYLIRSLQDAIRYYDMYPASTAIKLSFHDKFGAGPLDVISGAVNSVIHDCTNELEREGQFISEVRIRIALGYHKYTSGGKSENSCESVRERLEEDLKKYIKDEIIPILEKKYEDVDPDRVQALVDSRVSTEHIILPDGSIINNK